MRSRNNYNLFSEWSTPVVINLDNITVVRTEPTTMTSPATSLEQEQLPGYAYALIVVVTMVLVVVLTLLACLCIVYVRNNYYVDMVSLHVTAYSSSVLVVDTYIHVYMCMYSIIWYSLMYSVIH